MRIILTTLLIALNGFATKKGKNIQVESELRINQAQLFVIEASFKNDELSAIRILWLPNEMQEKCLNSSYEDCWSLRHKSAEWPPQSDWINSGGVFESKILNEIKEKCFSGNKINKKITKLSLKITTMCSFRRDIVISRFSNGYGFKFLK